MSDYSQNQMVHKICNEISRLTAVESIRSKIDILNGLRTMGAIRLDKYKEEMRKLAKSLGMDVEE